MCKDNTIITSWSEIGAVISGFFLIGGIIASLLGAHLTWGEITIIPFVVTFFLNGKRYYCFADSALTVRSRFRKKTVPVEEIKQIDIFGTKSGTWIVVELNGAPAIAPKASRKEIFSYYLQNRRKSFLIPLQWGERDKALEILRKCCPHKMVMKA